MSDERRLQRVEKLLEIRQVDEQAARQAFDEAFAAADDNHARLAACERELIDRHEQARQRLLRGDSTDSAQPYRDAVASLRERITQLMAERIVVDSRLESRREDLMAAMTRRRAAEIVRERVEARRAAADARRQTRLLDESHAASAACRKWRGNVADTERQET